MAQRMQAADQIAPGLVVEQGPFDYRGDHRQRVLDAVAKLGGQHFLVLFRRDEIDHVDKGQEDAIDQILGGAIGYCDRV